MICDNTCAAVETIPVPMADCLPNPNGRIMSAGMVKHLHILAVMAMITLTTACGFQPVYGNIGGDSQPAAEQAVQSPHCTCAFV